VEVGQIKDNSLLLSFYILFGMSFQYFIGDQEREGDEWLCFSIIIIISYSHLHSTLFIQQFQIQFGDANRQVEIDKEN